MPECITFVIINWNLKQDTADCIESLIAAGADIKQMIVVDNGSTDGSIDFLQGKFGSDLTIVGLDSNLGFAKGSNEGIKCALARQAEWIFLMNNDTVVDSDFVNQLEKAILAGQTEYALFSPVILYYNSPTLVWYLGDRILPGTLIGVNPYFGKKIDEIDVPDLFPIDFINGCGMLVNRKVFEKVGLMDTSLFIYHEEVDLNWRARKAGFRIAAVPKAKMWHKISSIMGKQKPKTRYLQTRNQIWVYRRHANRWQIPIMFAFTVFRSIRLIVQDIKMKQLDLLPHLWRGWWEGWTKNPHQGIYK